MIKKIFSLLLMLAPVVAQAQTTMGEWNIFKPTNYIWRYENNIWSEPFAGYRLIETPNNVFYCVNGSLCAYNKESGKTISYNQSNKLSDIYVKGMWYNVEKNYVAVVYSNANIDVIYDNGEVVNFPDIKDAIIVNNKQIYDIGFDGDIMYVGTAFGIVSFNVPGHYLKESGIYNVKITGIAAKDGKLVVTVGYDPFQIRYIDTNESRLTNWSNFTLLKDTFYGNTVRHLDGNKYVVRGYNSSSAKYIPQLLTVDYANKTCTIRDIVNDPIDYFQKTADGTTYVVQVNGTCIYTIDKDANYTKLTIPAAQQWNAINYLHSASDAWIGEIGVANMDLTTNPSTIKVPYHKPNTTNVGRAWILDITPSGKLLIGSMGVSSTYNPTSFNLWTGEYGYLNTYDGVNMEIVTPDPLTHKYSGVLDHYYDILGAAEDPEIPDTYWVVNWQSGLDKIQKNAQGKWTDVYRIDHTNSPVAGASGGVYMSHCQFDRNNNLWVVSPESRNPTASNPNIFVLPADKRNRTDISKTDWIPVYIPGFRPNWDANVLVCKHSNMIFFNDNDDPSHVIAYDTKGTATLDDDEYRVINSFKLDDGEAFEHRIFYSLCEDNEGRIWIGTHSGILEIADPYSALNPDMTVKRLKVPRTDGSGFYDYLLDSQNILDMSVDTNNNKWIATRTSGLYHVSAEGDKIFENYTSANSYLLDDLVYRVACNQLTGSVYASTPYGIVEYNSSVTQSSDNLDNIYAYPNPVQPDYTGWITIKGLMSGTKLKIVDSNDTVYLNTVTDGGVVMWDGCDEHGQRVKSGVYRVMVAAPGQSEAAMTLATKIMVVK